LTHPNPSKDGFYDVTCPTKNQVISFADYVIEHRSVLLHGLKLTAVSRRFLSEITMKIQEDNGAFRIERRAIREQTYPIG
jgi:hypothetical protein